MEKIDNIEFCIIERPSGYSYHDFFVEVNKVMGRFQGHGFYVEYFCCDSAEEVADPKHKTKKLGISMLFINGFTELYLSSKGIGNYKNIRNYMMMKCDYHIE